MRIQSRILLVLIPLYLSLKVQGQPPGNPIPSEIKTGTYYKWVNWGEFGEGVLLQSQDTTDKPVGIAIRAWIHPGVDTVLWMWDTRRWKMIGSTGAGGRFGIEDNTGIQDRTMNMGDYEFTLNSNRRITFRSNDNIGDGSSTAFFNLDGSTGTTFWTGLNMTLYSASIKFGSPNSNANIYIPDLPGGSSIDRNLALSVNGKYADAAGNITISTGGTGGGGADSADVRIVYNEVLTGAKTLVAVPHGLIGTPSIISVEVNGEEANTNQAPYADGTSVYFRYAVAPICNPCTWTVTVRPLTP